MKKLIVALAGGFIAGTSAAAWQPGEPVTTYWFGPGCPGKSKISLAMTDAWARQLKEGGFKRVIVAGDTPSGASEQMTSRLGTATLLTSAAKSGFSLPADCST